MAAMRQMRPLSKKSWPEHAPSSRGCAGGEAPPCTCSCRQKFRVRVSCVRKKRQFLRLKIWITSWPHPAAYG